MSSDDPNMSKESKSKSQSMSEIASVYSTGSASKSASASASTDANVKPTNVSSSKKKSKKKPKSSDQKSKSKPKSGKIATSGSKQSKAKAKSKKKSADRKAGEKSSKKKKEKSADEKKKSKKKSADNKKSKKKSGGKSASSSSASKELKEQKKICRKIRKVEASKGAVAVNSEKAIESAGYTVNAVAPYYTSDYSTVISAEAKKAADLGGSLAGGRLVVKVITLAECSPRARVNLLQNAVRIMRYVSVAGSEKDPKTGHRRKGPLSPIFVQVADIFLVGTVKLFVFMQYCPGRSVYDWVKAQRKAASDAAGSQESKEALQTMIRDWFKALVKGIHELQRIGVAHRAVKLQHVLLDENSKPKLIGWSKSVFFYKNSTKTSILMQKKERRVRSNLHLPPESFTGAYNPGPADVWSLGVALVAMTTGSYPFNVRDKKTKFSSQWRSFIKNHMMNTLGRNLCHRVFILDPKKRITTGELLKEKYFQAPVSMLTEASCKLGDAAQLAVKEDSHVGGMSAIENVQETVVKKAPLPPAAVAAAAAMPAGEEEPPPDIGEEADTDATGGAAAATGFEGGAVGQEEENLPPVEAEDECHLSQMNAPEEAEAEAQPEDGEEVDAEFEGDDGAGGGEEEEGADD